MPKKGRVPEVLWRMFGNRARRLSNTIISLFPPSPTPYDMSVLLRSDDSSDYRKLLEQCFVVVSENVAPNPISCFSPESHWSQHQIVTRTIEMIISEHSVYSNVIASGYDKVSVSLHIFVFFFFINFLLYKSYIILYWFLVFIFACVRVCVTV